MSNERQHYPRRAVIERAIFAAREAGISVSGIEIGPTGHVRIMTSAESDRSGAYDRWKAKERGK